MCNILSFSEYKKDLIKKISDELNRIKLLGIKHPTVDGDLHEDITRETYGELFVYFKKHNLYVSKGFVSIGGVKIEKYIDCIVSTEPGTMVDKKGTTYIYDISKVIAIVEVKKTLSQKNLKRSIEFLSIIKNKILENKETINLKSLEILASHAYCVFTGEDGVLVDIQDENKFLMEDLLTEVSSPIFIIDSFYGTGVEDAVNQLYRMISKDFKNFTPSILPKIIFSNDGSVIKNDGLPYYSDANNICLSISRESKIDQLIETLQWSLATRFEYKDKSPGIATSSYGQICVIYDIFSKQFSITKSNNLDFSPRKYSRAMLDIFIEYAIHNGDIEEHALLCRLLHKRTGDDFYSLIDELKSSHDLYSSNNKIKIYNQNVLRFYELNGFYYGSHDSKILNWAKVNESKFIFAIDSSKEEILIKGDYFIELPAKENMYLNFIDRILNSKSSSNNELQNKIYGIRNLIGRLDDYFIELID